MKQYSLRLDAGIALALEAFRTRTRKGSSVPYITHLLAVTALVGEYGGDEDQLIAAVLHDYLEDIPGTSPEALKEQFGERVARLVLALSDCHSVEEGAEKPPWQARKEQYLAELTHHKSEVKLISCADKLHNCMTLREDLATQGNVIWSRFTGKRNGTLWYYRGCVHSLESGWQHELLNRLRREVTALHQDAEHCTGFEGL